MNMKRLPIVILMIVAASFLAFKTMGKGNNTPPGNYEKIMKLVGEMLSHGHYSPQDINDAFSKKVFKKYITELEADKSIFLQSDIEALKKFERERIDFLFFS